MVTMLPVCYQYGTGTVPARYQSVTRLPVCYQSVTSTVPVRYQRGTNLLPGYQSVTSLLPLPCYQRLSGQTLAREIALEVALEIGVPGPGPGSSSPPADLVGSWTIRGTWTIPLLWMTKSQSVSWTRGTWTIPWPRFTGAAAPWARVTPDKTRVDIVMTICYIIISIRQGGATSVD